jgi:hypothetical protein
MCSTYENTDFALQNCIANEDSNCIECELNGELICFVDKKFANKFTVGNILYRFLAFGILIFSGFLIGHWWMLISYVSTVFITFVFIEPRLLCSHCPFYEKEGKCLRCWALRGMPKLWKYRPEPVNKTERILMLIFGSFIDLFPFLGSIWGIVYFFMNIEGNILLGVGIIICTVLFSIVAGYFSKVLLGFACKKCPNFSCAMNKVPKEIINKFLKKNPSMKDVWIKNGWKINE